MEPVSGILRDGSLSVVDDIKSVTLSGQLGTIGIQRD